MKLVIFCAMVLLLAGCKQAYDSPVHSPDTGYLVIEGVLNSAGNTVITLSRTTKLDNRAIVYETGAKVSVEEENGSTFFFTEQGNGKYGIGNFFLATGAKYRLHIHVSAGKDYISDFAAVINNPVIDSVSWKQNADGVQFYINTHDPQNNTRYYQWSYDETWQIQSSFYSYLKYQILPVDNYSVVYKFPTQSFDPDIINCWQYNSSTELLLGSTAKLTKDIVYLPLQFIPHASIKLGVLYSINVKQYSWTKEGYEFLEKMKKNTEATGSIFDAQPSELKGNIRCVSDSTEPVIGFFNICPVQERRIFISASDVKSWGYSSGCVEYEFPNISDSIRLKASNLLPTDRNKMSPRGDILTFYAAEPACVDCRLRGSNIKPAYWP